MNDGGIQRGSLDLKPTCRAVLKARRLRQAKNGKDFPRLGSKSHLLELLPVASARSTSSENLYLEGIIGLLISHKAIASQLLCNGRLWKCFSAQFCI